MAAIIFDGKQQARVIEDRLRSRVQKLQENGITLRVWTLTFAEDSGSVLYTRLKGQAAERIGIRYEPHVESIATLGDDLVRMIKAASGDPRYTGIMIQKPTKAVYGAQQSSGGMDFSSWWQMLTDAIDPTKDVDGLTGGTVIPATVRAVLTILDEAKKELHVADDEWKNMSALIVGRSDIVGKPLTAQLHYQCARVENIGRAELGTNNQLPLSFDIVVSATGVPNLITGDMMKPGAIVIDVGAPEGDVDRSSVEPVAGFLTPVPGGVGPMTVVSLMENVVNLSGQVVQ